MKKILYVIGKMDRGGAETVLMNVLRNINRKKYQFIIATFEAPTDGKKYVYVIDGIRPLMPLTFSEF